VRRTAAALALVVITAMPAAGDTVTVRFPAPLARVFAAVETALAAEGWGIDDADPALGLVVSKSRRLAGDDDGVHALTRRVRLRIQLTPAGPDVTAVTIARELFARERVLWMERDAPVVVIDPAIPPDRRLERRVFAAIGDAL
jgi:hypothetical protein